MGPTDRVFTLEGVLRDVTPVSMSGTALQVALVRFRPEARWMKRVSPLETIPSAVIGRMADANQYRMGSTFTNPQRSSK